MISINQSICQEQFLDPQSQCSIIVIIVVIIFTNLSSTFSTMSCLGLSEEVGLEAYLDNLDVDDDGDDQEEAREYISPFSVDEHYLEEPTSLGSSAASTEESTEQFQRGWRINRHAGDSWMYGMTASFGFLTWGAAALADDWS